MAKTTLIDESPFNSYKELFKTETGLDADKILKLIFNTTMQL
jgi:hypothetical protein